MKTTIVTTLIVYMILISKIASVSADELLGNKFMPVQCANFMIGRDVIPYNKIRLPFTVKQEKGEWLWVGNAWIKRSNILSVDDALEYYSNRLMDNPDDKWLLNARGFTWQAKGNFKKAIEDYNQALLIDPIYAHAFFGRGRAWKELKEYDKSIDDHTAALKIDPRFTQALNGRGISFKRKGEYEKAIRDYTKALEYEPNYLHARNNRGNTYGVIGEYQKAMTDLQETIRIAPDYALAYSNIAWLLATNSDSTLRDGKRAVVNAQKACELAKWKNPEYIESLAAAYAELGEFNKAVKYQKLFIEMSKKVRAEDKARLNLYENKKPYHN